MQFSIASLVCILFTGAYAVSVEPDGASLMQMLSKLIKRSERVEDEACTEGIEDDHSSMMQDFDFASKVRTRTRKVEDEDASTHSLECEEDDHTSLLQSSMDVDGATLMQMLSKLIKRSDRVDNKACAEGIEADHSSMMQDFDFASKVRTRTRKVEDEVASAYSVECEEEDHTSLLQSSIVSCEARADCSGEDHTSLLQSAIPSGLRISGRHGVDEDASGAGAAEVDEVNAGLFGSAITASHKPVTTVALKPELAFATAQPAAESASHKPVATVALKPELALATAQPAAESVDAFDLFDLDGDGELTRQEIAFQLSGPSVGAKAAGGQGETFLLQIGGGQRESEAAGAILATLDLDGEGTVSREEYDMQQYQAVLAQRRLEVEALRAGDDVPEDAEEFLP